MKPFCVLPFVQFSTTVSGDYQACCIAKQQQENIIDMSPLEFFNSKHMKQLRYDMLQKNISPLIKPKDAYVVDRTSLSIEEQVIKLFNIITNN